jgi:hypothetical protein
MPDISETGPGGLMIGRSAMRLSVLLSALSALCLTIALVPGPPPALAADDEPAYGLR